MRSRRLVLLLWLAFFFVFGFTPSVQAGETEAKGKTEKTVADGATAVAPRDLEKRRAEEEKRIRERLIAEEEAEAQEDETEDDTRLKKSFGILSDLLRVTRD